MRRHIRVRYEAVIVLDDDEQGVPAWLEQSTTAMVAALEAIQPKNLTVGLTRHRHHLKVLEPPKVKKKS